MKDIIIAPSILASNFLELGSEIEMLNQSDADWVHVDVMDGHFVPNLSFGFPIIKQVKEISTKALDVHLMISNPEQYVERYANVGANILSVHIEACNHVHRMIEQIHQLGMQAGVALNPHTPIEELTYIINDLDLVLLMSVNPGFGGQKFIEQTYQKIQDLRELIEKKNAKAKIEIDGGVSLQNASKLKSLGADILVAGSAVFKAENPKDMITALHQA